ncbi:MAG: hypothetical protein ACYS9X_11085 [Planctomycetota bacterium]|jgi:hypothetical protein
MKRPAAREVVFIAGDITGVAVIFLPFFDGYSPIGVLADAWPGEWQFLVITLVPLLAVPVLASTVRQAMLGPLTKWEVRAEYALAFVALVSTAFLMLFLRTGGPGAGILRAVITPSVLVLAAGGAVVLAATRKGRVPPATHAHVALLVAWMPNAMFCLLFFGRDGRWGAGFYLAIVTLVAYAIEATLRVRYAPRSRAEPGDEGRRS